MMRSRPQQPGLDNRQTEGSYNSYGYSLTPASSPYPGSEHGSGNIGEASFNRGSYPQFLPSSSSLLRQPEILTYNGRELTGAGRQEHVAFSAPLYSSQLPLDAALPPSSNMTPYPHEGFPATALPYAPNIATMPLMPGAMQQHRLPTGVPSRKPKTESKPMIDPVDNKQLCTFFMRTGTCAYGDRCRYKHPKDRPPPQLNSRGFPVREGEPDCEHYVKRGWCAFGVTCKFNHPESTAFVPMQYQQTGFVPMPGLVTVPYIPAYSYPAFSSPGLAAPAVYAPTSFPQATAMLPTPLRQDSLDQSTTTSSSMSSAIDKAAQSISSLSLQGQPSK